MVVDSLSKSTSIKVIFSIFIYTNIFKIIKEIFVL